MKSEIDYTKQTVTMGFDEFFNAFGHMIQEQRQIDVEGFIERVMNATKVSLNKNAKECIKSQYFNPILSDILSTMEMSAFIKELQECFIHWKAEKQAHYADQHDEHQA